LQISQGQPFEIIDGNNLQFIKEVYQRILIDKMQDDNILVVSVIGPQSSGKSLLLNTLFGT
jgi:pantothenate kinase-related protein Tda10